MKPKINWVGRRDRKNKVEHRWTEWSKKKRGLNQITLNFGYTSYYRGQADTFKGGTCFVIHSLLVKYKSCPNVEEGKTNSKTPWENMDIEEEMKEIENSTVLQSKWQYKEWNILYHLYQKRNSPCMMYQLFHRQWP